MDMSPWKCAWEGCDSEAGMKSRLTVEKPPRSASDIVLQSSMELDSENVMRGKGRLGTSTVSNLMAVLAN